MIRHDIYKLLGFATMTGEDPLAMWNRLRETQDWLVGPLSPDGWSGLTFAADHADVFAFRVLAIPESWLADTPQDKFAETCALRINDWFKEGPKWWERFGPKDPQDRYAQMGWRVPGTAAKVHYEWIRTAATKAVCRYQLTEPTRLVLHAYCPWSNGTAHLANLYAEGSDLRTLKGRSYVPGTRDGHRWMLASNVAFEQVWGTGSASWIALLPKVSSLYLSAEQGQRYEDLHPSVLDALSPSKIDQLLQVNRNAYLTRRPNGDGLLADAPSAINDQLQWSEVYTPSRRRPYITVSRAWAQADNSAPDFLWDSFFNALLVAQEDPRRARETVRDILSWQNAQGMLAQYGRWFPQHGIYGHPVAWGHTQYPIGSLAVAKLHLRHPDRNFLAEVYPKLLKSHRWWFADRGDGQPWRDGNRNGLLELGANYPEEIPSRFLQSVASFESHDDSPQWHGHARYNNETQTLEMDTVERNCLYAMDAWVLAWMARELGYEKDAVELEADHSRIRATIQRLLWNPERQCFFNRRWDGTQTPHIAPDIFFSLLGKVADATQAEALRRVFHDPNKFAGEWLLPTISRDDPQFPIQHYWKGKVWAPINWLVYQAFKLWEWDDEAASLAESGRRMFLRGWRERGHCYENFLATTGEGASDPHYTWGALLALVAIEELIDVTPWSGLRLGTLAPFGEAAIQRYPIAGAMFDVTVSPTRFEVRRDGHLLVSADGPVELRQVQILNGRLTAEARVKKRVTLVVAQRSIELKPGVKRIDAFIS